MPGCVKAGDPEVECDFFGDKWDPYYGIDMARLYGEHGHVFGGEYGDHTPQGLSKLTGLGDYPGSIGSDAKKRMEPWAFLAQGQNGAGWYLLDMLPWSGTSPHFSASFDQCIPFFAAFCESVRQVKRGPGQLIIGARPAQDGVRLLESPESMMVAHFDRADGTWRDSIANFQKNLDVAGIPCAKISPAQIAAGKLDYPGSKVLLLPLCKALSPAVAAAIVKFMQAGGTVIADCAPGIRDEHGAMLKESELAKLFPDGVTVCGKGRAVRLGADASRKFAGILQQAGVTPFATITDQRGKPADGLISRLHQDGEARYLFVIKGGAGGSVSFDASGAAEVKKDKTAARTEAYKIELPCDYFIYDVRAGKPLAQGKKLSLSLEPEDAQLLALLPEAPGELKLEADISKSREVKLEARVSSGLRHVLNIAVLGPDGKEMEFLNHNVEAPKGKYQGVVQLALNDPPGKYTIVAHDAATGGEAKAEVVVK